MLVLLACVRTQGVFNAGQYTYNRIWFLQVICLHLVVDMMLPVAQCCPDLFQEVLHLGVRPLHGIKSALLRLNADISTGRHGSPRAP